MSSRVRRQEAAQKTIVDIKAVSNIVDPFVKATLVSVQQVENACMRRRPGAVGDIIGD
jgi:hypothetical protein